MERALRGGRTAPSGPAPNSGGRRARQTGPAPRSAIVVSDVRFHRDGVMEALTADGRLDRVSGCDTASLSSVIAGARPDTVIVELDDGVGATLKMLGALAPAAAIVGLVVIRDAEAVVAATALGVRAFVGPDESLRELVATVARAGHGEAVCPPTVAALIFERLSSGRDLSPAAVLSAREREVAHGLARGLSNKEIATTLFVQPATIKNHVHSILRKLQVGRRGEAAALLRSIG